MKVCAKGFVPRTLRFAFGEWIKLGRNIGKNQLHPHQERFGDARIKKTSNKIMAAEVKFGFEIPCLATPQFRSRLRKKIPNEHFFQLVRDIFCREWGIRTFFS